MTTPATCCAGSFMDYAMPRAAMMPSFAVELAEDPTSGNPLKVKGGGEAGITPALAVIVQRDRRCAVGLRHRACRDAGDAGERLGRDPRGRNGRPMTERALGLGVIGLGMAGAVMVRAAARHPGVVLVAAADPQAAPREAFGRDFNAQDLCGRRARSPRIRRSRWSISRRRISSMPSTPSWRPSAAST